MENILKTGSLLKDRYRIKKLLFSGRFYNYYEAEDRSSRSAPVRIIELLLSRLPPPGRKVSEEQFIEQIDLYMTLSHPVLPAIVDGFYHGEAAYIIQKREEGISIEQYLSMAVNNFAVEDAIKIVTLIGKGLSYLYNRPDPIPFIHLDAAHIMIDDRGNVCLTGFGLHIFLDYYYSSTDPYAYCAPEVAEGKPFSVRSAVYSLGALFYNMITGSRFDIRRVEPAVMLLLGLMLLITGALVGELGVIVFALDDVLPELYVVPLTTLLIAITYAVPADTVLGMMKVIDVEDQDNILAEGTTM